MDNPGSTQLVNCSACASDITSYTGSITDEYCSMLSPRNGSICICKCRSHLEIDQPTMTFLSPPPPQKKIYVLHSLFAAGYISTKSNNNVKLLSTPGADPAFH